MIVGTGGVGKTTSSVAIGAALALQGKKVAVVSIDPAKRLADAVGIRLDGSLTQICETPKGGSLSACMIDVAQILSNMVRASIRDENERRSVFTNVLFKSLTQRLGGLIEFVSLYRVYELVTQGFDAVVLDTAPDLHAIDFLLKPGVLGGFLDNKVMSLLVKPLKILGSARDSKLGGAAQGMFKGLVDLAGLETLNRVVDFMSSLDKVILNLHQSGVGLDKLLRSENALFIAVTTPEKPQLVSLPVLLNALRGAGFSLGKIFINRCQSRSVLIELKCMVENKSLPETVRRAAFGPLQSEQNENAMIQKFLKYVESPDHLMRVEERLMPLNTVSDYLEFSSQYKVE